MSTPVQVWSYRNLIANLAHRELKSRYKRSFVGWMWSLINPAVTLAIYTVIFGVYLKAPVPVGGNGELQSFALFLFCGLVTWNLFAGVVNTSIDSFKSAGSLLTRTYFPPECPMVAGLITVILQVLMEAAILLVVMIVVSNISWTALFLLPVFALTACTAFGVGLVVGLANIRFRDVSYLVGIGMQALFYGTPIVYPLSVVPDEYRGWLKANPLTWFVDATREAVYLLDVPSVGNWLVMTAMAVVCLVGGWVIFSRWAPTVIEEL